MITLNPQQEAAVKHVEGPVLILAGAGSGKTRVIISRIINLIVHHNIPPWNILAVTFTNKAANEMKQRIAALSDIHDADKVTIGTFHSICAQILRREHDCAGLIQSFSIIDDSEQLTRIKRAISDAGFSIDRLNPRAVLDGVSKAKNAFMSPKDLLEQAGFDLFKKWLAAIYDHYESALATDHSLDFDDLIIKTVQLFTDSPDICEKYQRRYRYIMVDEYQDTNHAQYRLILLLSKNYRNLMVVGDDDQSIYRWRGADVSNILNFARDFPGSEVIKLEQNYRSTQIILSAASELMRHNQNRNEKKLWTSREGGEKIQVIAADDDRDEASRIIREIKKLHSNESRDFGEFAVFYRINAQSRVMEEAFISSRIPYRVLGNIGFFKRKEVKDLLAYIRLILNPFDSEACRRIINVPKRGIGRTTIEKIEQYAREHSIDFFSAIESSLENDTFQHFKCEKLNAFNSMIKDLIRVSRTQPLNVFISELIERSGYREFYASDDTVESRSSLEIIQEFESAASDYQTHFGGDLKEFADYLALHESQSEAQDENPTDRNKQVVSLLTLHNAKGLEFPVVFISGVEEGLCPYYRANEELAHEELEEERRLMYVGMTRAKEKLHFLFARERMLHGGKHEYKPSRFLKEIPKQYCSYDVAQTRQTIKMERGTTDRSIGTGSGVFGRNSGIQSSESRQTLPVTSSVKVSHPSSFIEFKPGERVHHQQYGIGTITQVQGQGPGAKVSIHFDRLGLKKLLLGPARLTKIH